MDPGFFSRPPGLWLATLGVAALLFGLGYEAAQHGLEPPLEQARRELAEQTSRANRLAAENQSLEARLAQAQARLGSGRPADRASDLEAEAQGPHQRVVHQGEASVLLAGKLVILVEDLLASPRRAVLRFQVAGGQETTRVLAVGQSLEINVNGRNMRLVLRRILTSAVVVSLDPA